MPYLPGLLGHCPHIPERPAPVNHMLEDLGSGFRLFAFEVVLIGTCAETGTGMIHASNERLAGALTWVFTAVLAVPLFTIGAWKVFGPRGKGVRG